MEFGGTKKKNNRKWSDLALATASSTQDCANQNLELNASKSDEEKLKIEASAPISNEEKFDSLLKEVIPMLEGVAINTITDVVADNDKDADATTDTEEVISKIMKDLERLLVLKKKIKERQMENDLQSPLDTIIIENSSYKNDKD